MRLQEGPDGRPATRIKRFAAIAVASLAIGAGGVAGVGCGDDDNEGAVEEAGKAVDEAANEAGQAADEGVDAADKAEDEADEGEGKKGGGKPKSK